MAFNKDKYDNKHLIKFQYQKRTKPVKDITGKIFNRLTILKFSGYKQNSKGKGQRQDYWITKCECGNIKEISGTSIRQGKTKSCGCLLQEYLERLPRLLVERNIKVEGYSAKSLVVHRYKVGAKARNLSFELSREQIISLCSSNCYYCGIEPNQLLPESRVKNGNFLHNGIDRKDNTLGYTLENCVPCCKVCNYAKTDYSEKEFKEWIERLVKFNSR